MLRAERSRCSGRERLGHGGGWAPLRPKQGAMIVPLERARWTVAGDERGTRRRAETGRETIPFAHAQPVSRPKGRSPLTEEQQRLASQYLPLARSMAQRLARYWPAEREELESTAYMALVEAAQSFDPDRKVGFGTFARFRIRGALRDFQRLMNSAGGRGGRENPPVFQRLGKDAEEYGQVIGIQPDGPVGSDIEAIEAVEDWLGRLPRAHAAACRLIYVHGKSQEDAAAHVGCSKSYLSRLHREAITWLVHEARGAREGSARTPGEPVDR